MLYALNENNEIVEAQNNTQNKKLLCPTCKSKVIPKTGSIKIWHFAHENQKDCDSWSEGETEWHRNWKEKVDKKNREVTIGNHRADIQLNNKLVIELQNSPITKEEVKERNLYYKKIVWVINCTHIKNHFVIKQKEKHHSFKWKWYKKTLQYAWNLNLDFGDQILSVQELYDNGCGWGYLLSTEEFCSKYAITKEQ